MAIARPMPRLAPVTMATRLSIGVLQGSGNSVTGADAERYPEKNRRSGNRNGGDSNQKTS